MPANRIFFVTDVHGSDVCFRKFLNAGKFYNSKVLILGGDITGKVMVPMIKQKNGAFTCSLGGKSLTLKSRNEADEIAKDVRNSGFYPYYTEPNEVEELAADPELVKKIFTRLMVERVQEWMKLAEERLRGTGIGCYISPGNDDVYDIDEALNSSTYVINPEEKVEDIDGEHEMITLGSSNHTPWNSPREMDEETLLQKIEAMATRVKDTKKALFNIHVPPINTPIDAAPKLDENLKPIVTGGGVVTMSAGSTATRHAVEKYQPLIGLHGHIHESRGMVKIGRTMCFNPGSEYGTGVLRGLLCDLEDERIKSYLLTSG